MSDEAAKRRAEYLKWCRCLETHDAPLAIIGTSAYVFLLLRWNLFLIGGFVVFVLLGGFFWDALDLYFGVIAGLNSVEDTIMCRLKMRRKLRSD